jgi:hypothetical protein
MCTIYENSLEEELHLLICFGGYNILEVFSDLDISIFSLFLNILSFAMVCIKLL